MEIHLKRGMRANLYGYEVHLDDKFNKDELIKLCEDLEIVIKQLQKPKNKL